VVLALKEFDFKDVLALASACITLLKDEPLRKRFGEYARDVAVSKHDRTSSLKKEKDVCSLNNLEICLIEPVADEVAKTKDISDLDGYVSEDVQYRGMSFKDYASSIAFYPDEYFDVILIDGRARPSCFKHAKEKVKRGGLLILDNADRKYYFRILDSLNTAEWEKYVFFGPVPYITYFAETRIFKRSTSIARG